MPEMLISFDEEEWLEQRRKYITATEIAHAIRSPKYARQLYEEKSSGVQKFQGNAATRWGKEREPAIAAYVQHVLEPRLKANDNLFVSDNGIIAATPDMVDKYFELGQPIEIIGEIKTVTEKNDWRGKDIPKVYADQIQTQLYVSTAEKCLLVWEPYTLVDGEPQLAGDVRHTFVDSTGHEVTVGDIQVLVVRRDEGRIRELVEFGYRHMRGEFKEQEVPDITELLGRYSVLQKEINSRKAESEEIREQLRGVVGSEPASYEYPGLGIVTVKKPAVRKTFDTSKFRKEHPDLARWYMTEKVSAPTLSITLDKERK